MRENRLIESDEFPFEFISQLAERESWRKEAFRPVYYLHKWWAKRLGSVFRGILLGSLLPVGSEITKEFYKIHDFSHNVAFDPFMGSGVTIGEAHKLGLTVLGRDINPVAYESVRRSFGSLKRTEIEKYFEELENSVGKKILSLYSEEDEGFRISTTLYYFWVMQAICPKCKSDVDLFPSYIIAYNYSPDPRQSSQVQVVCPSCNEIFPSTKSKEQVTCPSCEQRFSPQEGNATRANATCSKCGNTFVISECFRKSKPSFRLFGKLVLDPTEEKKYHPVTDRDIRQYLDCSKKLQHEVREENIRLPLLKLEEGYNTSQAMNYGFLTWKDFFNDRQLLALGWLQAAIAAIENKSVRDAFLLLFSGTLEFNNMFASYKGEATGAVRHMFYNHILKPERVPLEANVWGTPKSSGSFSTLFKSRLLRAISYREVPTEIDLKTGGQIMCSQPFSGEVEPIWPKDGKYNPRAIYLSVGDSAESELGSRSIDVIVTDPPFFDNVHYSELADFFYAWQQLYNGHRDEPLSTRNIHEVQDADAERFSKKLQLVFKECDRVLKQDGLLIFTYHHSRSEGWQALRSALVGSGFVPVNTHPVKSELSVATPKFKTNDPIQLDTIIVCRKLIAAPTRKVTIDSAIRVAKSKIKRLQDAGLKLSNNDCKVVYYGQLLTTIEKKGDLQEMPRFVMNGLELLELS